MTRYLLRMFSVKISGLLLGLLFFGTAQALESVPYSPEAVSKAQAEGKPLALHFHAPWCGTCVSQEKVFDRLKTDPGLAGLTLYVVDYDSNRPLRRQLKVRSQSTIIVYQGSKEVARSGGETQLEKIRSLLTTAL